MKRLTTETLQRYVGGQLEIRNYVRTLAEPYLYCGEVATIVVENNTLYVKFAWVARNVGLTLPLLTSRWVKHDNLSYAVDLRLYRANRVGEGPLALTSRALSEIALFHLPNDRQLDPSNVEGLELPLQKANSATTE